MARTVEFHYYVARASRVPPSLAPESGGRDPFTAAAQSIAEIIRSMLRRVRRMTNEDAQQEQMLTIFAAQCVNKLRALESRVNSGVASSSPQLQSHRRGLISCLYQLLKLLMAEAPTRRTAVSLSSRMVAMGTPAETPAFCRSFLDPARLPFLALAARSRSNPSNLLAEPSASCTSPPLSSPPSSAPSGEMSTVGVRRRITDSSAPSTVQPPVITAASDADSSMGNHLHSAMVTVEHARCDATESLRIEQQMQDVSAMLSILSERLEEQQESIDHILDESAASATFIDQGNRELMIASKRPDHLKKVAAFLLFAFSAMLLFLDWYAR